MKLKKRIGKKIDFTKNYKVGVLMEKALQNNVNIDDAINKAVKVAIREFDKEKKEEQRERILYNTKLLLKNYNNLKSHIDEAVSEVKNLEQDLDIDDLGDIDKEKLYIVSIKKSKAKTLLMIAHIDVALKSLMNKQYRLCSIEKYRALEKYYINNRTYEEIAEELNCSVITAKRWVKEMVKELSINLFGLDGMKLDMVQ